MRVFTDHGKYVFALSFSPDGGLLASGGGDGSLYVYDVKVSSGSRLIGRLGLTVGSDSRTNLELVVRRKDRHFRD